MGSRRREGHHRPRRHPPVSLTTTSALMVISASPMRVRRTVSGGPRSGRIGPVDQFEQRTPERQRGRACSPMRVTPRVSSRDTTRLGITTTDSPSRLAQRLEIRLSQHALDHSRGAKSVFVMSQREVEMHHMESRFATLIARLEHHSRRLRGRRNTTSNRVENR